MFSGDSITTVPIADGRIRVRRRHHRADKPYCGRLGRPESTVRRRLRGVRGDHRDWLWWQGHEAAVLLDPNILDRATHSTRLGDALNVLAGAALTYRKRYDLSDSVWALIGLLAGGRLLEPSAPFS